MVYPSIVKNAMTSVWNRHPRHYQSVVISLVLRMITEQDYPSEGILLVQGTGSGKSMVYQTCSIIDSGVSIIIEPTLSLSSNQSSKYNVAKIPSC